MGAGCVTSEGMSRTVGSVGSLRYDNSGCVGAARCLRACARAYPRSLNTIDRCGASTTRLSNLWPRRKVLRCRSFVIETGLQAEACPIAIATALRNTYLTSRYHPWSILCVYLLHSWQLPGPKRLHVCSIDQDCLISPAQGRGWGS